MLRLRTISSRKHKNSKLWYYTKCLCREVFPRKICQLLLARKKNTLHDFVAENVLRRVNYYNKLDRCEAYAEQLPSIREFKRPKRARVYYFDTYEYLRYFSKDLRLAYLPGDIIHVPRVPTIVKSRPIAGDNANSVLLNLNKVRHFMFVEDAKPFAEKKNMLIGRSAAHQPNRVRFLEMYFNHPMCNVGQTNRNANADKWLVEKMTLEEHLNYKFILCLEGHDVATNLKWVMSSNSLAVMPKPKYESWFMEGTLIPNYHYVLIKDDYSDLEEILNHYISHPDEALQILKNAHAHVAQFRDKKREDLISLLVLDKYFQQTGQNP